MVRQRRSRRNRRVTPRPRNANARIASGLPYKPRRVRTDPPEMPIALTQSMRLRFNISAAFDKANGGKFSTFIGSTPFASHNVFLLYGENGSTATAFELTKNDISMAAFIQLYGVPFQKKEGNVNVIATELAIEKVTYYGAISDLASREISMQVDFGEGPGFMAKDIGDKNRRAVVTARTPKLHWFYVTADQSVFLRADVGRIRSPMFEIGNSMPDAFKNNSAITRFELGCLDVSICLRRAFQPTLAVPPARTGATEYAS